VAILAEERGVRVRVETPEEMCMLGDAGRRCSRCRGIGLHDINWGYCASV
jgi:hypothetical protein